MISAESTYTQFTTFKLRQVKFLVLVYSVLLKTLMLIINQDLTISYIIFFFYSLSLSTYHSTNVHLQASTVRQASFALGQPPFFSFFFSSSPGIFPWHSHASAFSELGHILNLYLLCVAFQLISSAIQQQIFLKLVETWLDVILKAYLTIYQDKKKPLAMMQSQAESLPCNHNIRPYIMVTGQQLQAGGFHISLADFLFILCLHHSASIGSINPDNRDHRSFAKPTQLSQPIKGSCLSNNLTVQFMILLQAWKANQISSAGQFSLFLHQKRSHSCSHSPQDRLGGEWKQLFSQTYKWSSHPLNLYELFFLPPPSSLFYYLIYKSIIYYSFVFHSTELKLLKPLTGSAVSCISYQFLFCFLLIHSRMMYISLLFLIISNLLRSSFHSQLFSCIPVFPLIHSRQSIIQNSHLTSSLIFRCVLVSSSSQSTRLSPLTTVSTVLDPALLAHYVFLLPPSGEAALEGLFPHHSTLISCTTVNMSVPISLSVTFLFFSLFLSFMLQFMIQHSSHVLLLSFQSFLFLFFSLFHIAIHPSTLIPFQPMLTSQPLNTSIFFTNSRDPLQRPLHAPPQIDFFKGSRENSSLTSLHMQRKHPVATYSFHGNVSQNDCCGVFIGWQLRVSALSSTDSHGAHRWQREDMGEERGVWFCGIKKASEEDQEYQGYFGGCCRVEISADSGVQGGVGNGEGAELWVCGRGNLHLSIYPSTRTGKRRKHAGVLFKGFKSKASDHSRVVKWSGCYQIQVFYTNLRRTLSKPTGSSFLSTTAWCRGIPKITFAFSSGGESMSGLERAGWWSQGGFWGLKRPSEEVQTEESLLESTTGGKNVFRGVTELGWCWKEWKSMTVGCRSAGGVEVWGRALEFGVTECPPLMCFEYYLVSLWRTARMVKRDCECSAFGDFEVLTPDLFPLFFL
ncbi:hypothetical protein VP01_875g2 [Puccinia sorghi]|uniref:Uncharacterized protein n=1 Tax=Puccinia sorghi TaxID=27349 RepID=A0A0L6U9B2_9BASI|nr:hypothetical protein VP01_875g2 [Puccinia sorghi]